MFSPNRKALCYESDRKVYEDYYVEQAGRGMPVFIGAHSQRGYGLGSIFGGLMRLALPLLKKGTKALGKQALKSSVNIAGDIIRGHKPGHIVKTRGPQILSNTVNQLLSPPGEPLKKKRKRSVVIHNKVKHRKRSNDIFK